MDNEHYVTNFITYIKIGNWYLRIEHNNALNVSCDFNGYLVCQIPKNTIEVELRIKTWGKYTLNKDTYTRTERYHPWNRTAQIHTKKRRTPRREAANIDNSVDSTSSKTDILDGEGFAFAPKVFTNQNIVATVPQTEEEGTGPVQGNFIGNYCKKCANKYNRCWCNGSDWDGELMELELPKAPTNDQNNKTNNTKWPNNLTLVSVRQPPPGWLEFWKSVISKSKSTNAHIENKNRANGWDNTIDEIPWNRIIIREIRTISNKEFEEM